MTTRESITVFLIGIFLGSGGISCGTNFTGSLICLLDRLVPSGKVSMAISASMSLLPAWSHSEHCLLFELILLSVFLPSNSFLFPFDRSIIALQCCLFLPYNKVHQLFVYIYLTFQVAQWVKNPPAMQETGEVGSILGSGRSPGGGYGNPLQYSCLENPMERGAWWASVQRIAKSHT